MNTRPAGNTSYLRVLLALTLASGLGFPGAPGGRCLAQSLITDGLEPDWSLSLDAAHHALRANPARANAAEAWSVRLTTTRLFGLSSLQPVGASVVLPTPSVRLIGGVRYLGLPGYREVRFSGGLASGGPLAFGVRLDAHRISIPGYDALHRLSLAPGWRFRASGRLRLSAHLDPLIQSGRPRPTRPARAVVTGLLVSPSDETALSLDIGTSFHDPLRVRAGIEWTPVPAFRLRGGYTTAPTSYGGGFEFRLGRLSAEAGGSRHAWLGWTRSLAVSFRGR